MTALPTLRPDADGSCTDVLNTGGSNCAANMWDEIDDDPDSPTTSNYIVNNNTKGGGSSTSGELFVSLGNMPADFGQLDALQVDADIAIPTAFTTSTMSWFAQVFQSNESTTLTDEVTLATEATSDGLVSVSFNTINSPTDKTAWDGARLRLRWDYNQSGGDHDKKIRITAIELDGTYTEAAAATDIDLSPQAIPVTLVAPTFGLSYDADIGALAVPVALVDPTFSRSYDVALAPIEAPIVPNDLLITLVDTIDVDLTPLAVPIVSVEPAFGLVYDVDIGVLTIPVAPIGPTFDRSYEIALGILTIPISPTGPSFSRSYDTPLSPITLSITQGDLSLTHEKSISLSIAIPIILIDPEIGIVGGFSTVNLEPLTVVLLPIEPVFSRRWVAQRTTGPQITPASR